MRDTLLMPHDQRQTLKSLSHVYWIGGGAAAGKSSISRRLARDHGFTLFSGDKRWIEHWRTSTRERHPVAHRIGLTLDGGEPFDWFFSRSGQEIADDYIAMARVEFEESVNELLRMPNDKPVIVDAFLGLPQLVLTVARPDRAVFLICTDDFLRNKWIDRTTPGSPDFLPILRRQIDTCADPELAVDNFIRSNVVQNRFIAEDCRRSRATLIVTGGRIGLEDAYVAVTRSFGLER